MEFLIWVLQSVEGYTRNLKSGEGKLWHRIITWRSNYLSDNNPAKRVKNRDIILENRRNKDTTASLQFW